MKYFGTITNDKDIITKEYADALPGSIRQSFFDCIYPVGIFRTQLPGEDSPNTLFNSSEISSSWQDVTDTVSGKFFQYDDTNAVGTDIPAELPNIKGWYASSAGYGASGHSGAIQEGWIQSHRFSEVGTGTNIGNTNFTFSADLGQVNADGNTYVSQADSVYKNGGKVQPPALTVKLWKRIA